MWLGLQVLGAAWTFGYDQPVSSQGAFSIDGDNHGDGEGGLSSEVKGTLRFHSKTAAASEGTIADSCDWICPASRV